MKSKTCMTLTDLAFTIELSQQGVDNFTVTYGKQVHKKLTYTQAAKDLGSSIMHALACDSRLDNRERGGQ